MYSVSPRIRKDGSTRFLEISLTEKQIRTNEALPQHRLSHNALKAKVAKLDAALVVRTKTALSDQTNGADRSRALDSNASDDMSDDIPARFRSASLTSSDDVGEGEDLMEMDQPPVACGSKQKANDAVAAATKSKKTVGKQSESLMSPQEIRLLLRMLFATDHELLDLVFSPHGPSSSSTPLPSTKSKSSQVHAGVLGDMFFMTVLAVPPTRFRPASTMGDQTFENPQNELLSKVLSCTIRIRDRSQELALASSKPANGVADPTDSKDQQVRIYGQLLADLVDCQIAVNSLMDSTKNPMPVRAGKLPPQGVKQILEKKEGLFRKNMMVRLQPFFCCLNDVLNHSSRRASVLITQHAPSFRQTSTLKRMRSACRLSLRPSLPSRNRSLNTMFASCSNSSSMVRGYILVPLSFSEKMVACYHW